VRVPTNTFALEPPVRSSIFLPQPDLCVLPSNVYYFRFFPKKVIFLSSFRARTLLAIKGIAQPPPLFSNICRAKMGYQPRRAEESVILLLLLPTNVIPPHEKKYASAGISPLEKGKTFFVFKMGDGVFLLLPGALRSSRSCSSRRKKNCALYPRFYPFLPLSPQGDSDLYLLGFAVLNLSYVFLLAILLLLRRTKVFPCVHGNFFFDWMVVGGEGTGIGEG